jgi:alpha-D-xyloside xylohydrolase
MHLPAFITRFALASIIISAMALSCSSFESSSSQPSDENDPAKSSAKGPNDQDNKNPPGTNGSPTNNPPFVNDPRSPLPDWGFEHWVWEDESTQDSVMALVNDYQAHDIPVGAVIIDSPWATGYNTFEFDKTRFPDAKKMIDDLHAKKVKVMLWVVPAINTDVTPLYTQAKDKSYFMEKVPFSGPGIVDWWKGKGSLIDYFSPSAVSFWHSRVDAALALGIDGWKCDGLDISVQDAPFSRGKAGLISRRAYGDAYYRDFYEYTRSKLGNDRIITGRPIDTYGYDTDLVGTTALDQAMFAPRDVNLAGWVGDQDATFPGLKAALLNMYFSAREAYLAFGSDIGGYREDDTARPLMRTKQVLIRWAQLGALSPIMENGGAGEHRPWMFDLETTNIYRRFTKLHHALIPYLASEAGKAWPEKKSMMTFFDKADLRFLLGSDLFVAPMLEDANTRVVTFPPGASEWTYIFDKSKTFAGGSMTTLNVPIDQYPVFVKKGSVLASSLVVP